MSSAIRAMALIGAVLVCGLSSSASAQAARAVDESALPSAPIPYRQLAHPLRVSPARKAASSTRPAAGPIAARAAATPLAARPRPAPALGLGAVAAPGGAAASTPPVRRDPVDAGRLAAFVDGVVNQAMATDHVPGVVVAVVQGDHVLLEKGYGASDATALGRLADPGRTLFRLGSISKVFTWIAVMKAQSDGRLRLSAPVNALLAPPLRIPAEGFAAPIRLEQLMSHTAGFESRELGRSFASAPDRLTSLAQTLVRVRPRRVREPGETSSYSNYGAALAGAVLASVEHGEFDDLVERQLLAPAGLTSTTFREPYSPRVELPRPLSPELASRFAQGFSWGRTGLTALPFAWAEGLAPALSASSTAHDMGRLMQILLAGGRTPEGVAVWTPEVDLALRTPLHRTVAGFPGWTHGLMEEPFPGGLVGLGHDGAAPGFRAKFVVVPALDLGVFVAGNSETAGRLTERLAPALVEELRPSPVVRARAGAEAHRLDGLYLTTRRAYHGLEGFTDRLTGLSRVRVAGAGRILITQGSHRQSWLGASADQFTDDGATKRLVFLPPGRGRASTYLASNESSAAERVGPLHHPATLAWTAALAAVAALLSLAGPFVRNGRDEARQTPSQAFSSGAQLVAALLHLASLGAFAMFLRDAADPVRLTLNWPDGWLLGASWAALAAVLLTLVQAFQLPRVWRGTRRLPGWTGGRRLRHTLSVVLFLIYGAVAAGWGALEPWSS